LQIRITLSQMTVVAALASALAGCGAEKGAEKGAGGTGQGAVPPPLAGRPVSAGVERFRGEAGRRTSTRDDFPVSIPTYPDARLIASMQQRGRGHVRSYLAGDDADEVSRFYLDRLSEEGWHVDFDGHAEGLPMIALSRGAQHIRISVERRSDGSLIHVAAAPVD